MTHGKVLGKHMAWRHAMWVTHGIELSHVSSACQVHGVSGNQWEISSVGRKDRMGKKM